MSNDVDQQKMVNVAGYVLLIPALMFVAVACLLTRAAGRAGRKLRWCPGPGIATPLRVHWWLVERERLFTVVAFAAAALVTGQVVIGDGAFAWRQHAPAWAASFISLVLGIAVGVLYWPIFAALIHSHPLIYLLGFIYSIALSISIVLVNLPCRNHFNDYDWVDILLVIFKWGPILSLQLIVLCSLPIRGLRLLLGHSHSQDETTHELYHYSHSRLLLKAQRPGPGQERAQLMDSIVRNPWRYRVLPGFRFSSLFLATIVMCIVFSLFLFAGLVEGYIEMKNYWDQSFAFIYNPDDAKPTYFSYHLNDLVKQGMLDLNIVRETEGWTTSFTTAYLLSCFATLLLITASMLLMLRNYRTHTLLLYRGDYSQIYWPRNWTANNVAANGVRYMGAQFGYMIWAFFLQFIFFFLISFGLLALIRVIFHYEQYHILTWALERAGPVILYIIFINIIQRLALHFLFLRPDSRGKRVLAFKNHRAFANYKYIMTFASAPLGVFSCLQRMARATCFGLWVLPRLDMSTLSRGFERFDPGYPFYASLVLLETSLRNPVLTVFINFLLQDAGLEACVGNSTQRVAPLELRRSNIQTERRRRWKMVRNRWALAYTLHSNPGLRIYRSRLSQQLPSSPSLSFFFSEVECGVCQYWRTRRCSFRLPKPRLKRAKRPF